MRTLTLALLVLASGCATTATNTPRKTAAERAAEIARYREQKAAEEAAKKRGEAAPQAQQPVEPTPAPTASTPPEERPTPAPAPVVAGAPGPVGPRTGLFGLRATLLGNGLAVGQSAGTTSTLGLRYFVGDSLGVNLNAGFAYASVREASVTGLSLGVGLNFFGGAQDKPLRPFFALEGTLSQVGMKEASTSVLSLAAGGGAEYWLTPQLSVSASLLLGFATAPNEESFVVGTFQPGLGVTLYTN